MLQPLLDAGEGLGQVSKGGSVKDRQLSLTLAPKHLYLKGLCVSVVCVCLTVCVVCMCV